MSGGDVEGQIIDDRLNYIIPRHQIAAYVFSKFGEFPLPTKT